jgi:hypothetical protein
VADAVLKLPFLGKREATGTQIGTQNLFREGHDLSTADMKSMGITPLELPVNQQDGQQKDSPVQTGQTLEMVRGTGFELLIQPWNSSHLQARTHKETHKL